MSKWWWLLLAVPALVFVNLYQAWRYESFRREVLAREALQKQWLEDNKQLLTGIAVLSSPQRIGDLAQRELGLGLLPSQKIIKVQIDPRLTEEGR